MVQAIETKSNGGMDSVDSSELTDEACDVMGDISGAAGLKVMGNDGPSLNRASTSIGHNDAKMHNIYNQELSHLREQIYEKGYNPKTEETLREATKEQQEAWFAQKSQLL